MRALDSVMVPTVGTIILVVVSTVESTLGSSIIRFSFSLLGMGSPVLSPPLPLTPIVSSGVPCSSPSRPRIRILQIASGSGGGRSWLAVPPAGPLPCASGCARPRTMTPRPPRRARAWRHFRPQTGFPELGWPAAASGGRLSLSPPAALRLGLARHPQAQPSPRSWARRGHCRNRGWVPVVTSSLPVAPALRRAIEGSGGAGKHDQRAQPETRTVASKARPVRPHQPAPGMIACQ
jgi:hypothetical protein